ncbi:kinase domain protein [Rothia aeria F0184]|jgi:hypothetical protein|uniref:non-specific serine/threonine protein kinase n=2 Tax=Micrococcaceae TaxID=1268 RepID=U7UX08_9MICC|nr:kinase domain protein [Rothia aeria F0184]
MAEVYYATDTWLNDSPVAIKILKPELAASPENQRKFYSEESSLRQMGGGHVIGVLSSGEQTVRGQKLRYIVMEYVHGCTLGQLLRERGALSVGEALQILLPVVEGLSEAHARRLVHSDIKPGNILLDVTETVKLADFGLTRRDDQALTGEIMGTPAYAAPELVKGQQTGAPADIFALGVMMYLMFAGHLPFDGIANSSEVHRYNANVEIPPVAEAAPGLDPGLAGLISWCTRQQPEDRPENALEVLTDLRDVTAHMSEEELAWRTPLVEEPEVPLWEAVEHIAETTGLAQMVHNSPISGIGRAEDLLVDTNRRAQAAKPVLPMEEYVPLSIGIGPETRPVNPALARGDIPLSGQRSLDGSSARMHYGALRPELAQRSPNNVFGLPRTPPGPNRSPQRRPASHPQARPGPRPFPRNRRLPAERLGPPPSPFTVVTGVVVLLVALVLAGFVGWLLAQSVLQSTWWANLSQMFGGL